jgi:PAS domain S-box-containing protein
MALVNLIGSYNYALVALSVLIAMFASYVALDLAGRVTAASGWTQAVWLLGGAAAMGTGIWSMHYIGMLAFILPVPVAYHWPTVLLSLFAAILASVIALYVVSRQKMSSVRALSGSVLMGAGIASMHYIGMAAMRLPAMCQFNTFLVVLSVVFAVLISLVALWITFHFREEETGSAWRKIAGAAVMGAAIPVMHYTGMAAAQFKPSGMPVDLSNAVSISTLSTAGIAIVTLIVLGLALLTSWLDRRFAAQALELHRSDERYRQLAKEKLQQSEAYLSEAQRLSHTGSFGWKIPTGELLWSEETFSIFQYERATKPTVELVLKRVHPEDAAFLKQAIERASQEGKEFDLEHRLLMPDGSIKHLHVLARAMETSTGNFELVGAVTDITRRKRSEEELRRSEMYLAEAQRLTHTSSWAWQVKGRNAVHLSEQWYRIYGFDLIEGMPAWSERLQRIHPEDRAKWQGAIDRAIDEKSDYEVEFRILLPDGTVKYIRSFGHPVLAASGELIEFMGSSTDITERKQAEEALRKAFEEIKGLRDRLYQENIALKEEVDQKSMFEEIVGTSPALREVLSRVSKVAPTDSTVLITGETGTGKELIARAVHKRSQRSSRPFVSVNCAAIPRDLIASELFGHEKGAFTGAMQRRIGRFELAEGGTIFLDEIGELPAETQVALLRVLQEREFERVGGTVSIRADVRVIAATNRDLQAAIAAGTFRSDLFYRLNVFPIEVPPLRERREDIPVLVVYFIDRFARKAGKSIRSVNKMTMELLQSYPWPGNIRELQNVVERSVIVCDSEKFSVDESWLSLRPLPSKPKSQTELSRTLADEEKEMIEAALRESGGRVSGPSGAAVRLGIPGSTLESKIKSLKIDKNRFKPTYSSTDRD